MHNVGRYDDEEDLDDDDGGGVDSHSLTNFSLIHSLILIKKSEGEK